MKPFASGVRSLGQTIPGNLKNDKAAWAMSVTSTKDSSPFKGTASQVVAGYDANIEGTMNGDVIRLWGGLEHGPRC